MGSLRVPGEERGSVSSLCPWFFSKYRGSAQELSEAVWPCSLEPLHGVEGPRVSFQFLLPPFSIGPFFTGLPEWGKVPVKNGGPLPGHGYKSYWSQYQ